MNKKLLFGISVCAITLFSCNEGWDTTPSGGGGYIIPTVDLDNSTVSSSEIGTRDGEESPEITISDLTLKLSKESGEEIWEGNVDGFPTDRAFAVGSYKLEAFKGDATQEGFDLPAVYGSQTLTVMDGKTTPVSLTATPSNARIKIVYTSEFQKYMAEWDAMVNNVEYKQDETRDVYVAPGNVNIKLHVKKPNGVEATFTLDPLDAKARYIYTVTVNVNNGEVGDASLEVTFDSNFDEKPIEINLSDKVLNSPLPKIDIEGFQSNEAINLVEGLINTRSLTMSLIAQAGIKGVSMETVSASLNSMNWPTNIDLMAAENYQSTFKNLGLDVLGLWKTPGEMGFLDFTNVVENISVIENADNVTTFTVKLKDALMRETEPVVLKLNVEPVKLVLSKEDTNYSPGDNVKVGFEFNGSKEDIEEGNVKFQYQHSRGVFDDLKVTGVTVKESGMYIVELEIPGTHNDDLILQAVCGSKTSGQLVLSLAPFVVTAEEVNIFATQAYVKIVATGDEEIVINSPEFYGKGSDDTDFIKLESSEENGYYRVKGLKPGTVNQIRVRMDGMTSKSTNLTTEAALEVPNGDFEDLSGYEYYEPEINQGGGFTVILKTIVTPNPTIHQTKVNWKIDEPYNWITNNNVSMGGTANTWFRQPSVFNSSLSYTSNVPGALWVQGTPTTPASYKIKSYKGNSMIIRNVAWDPNGIEPNTHISTKSRIEQYYNSNKPNIANVNVGKMVLGTYYNSTSPSLNEEGISFKSRPMKLKGYYKYSSPDANEKAVVEVKVLNGNQIIASKIKNLDQNSEYDKFDSDSPFGEFEVDLTDLYNINSSKADRIYIMMTSSNKTSDFVMTDYLSTYEAHRHGATLVVDDLTFEY